MFNLFLDYAPQANCAGGLTGELQIPISYLIVALDGDLKCLPYLQLLVKHGASYRYQPKKLDNIKILNPNPDFSRLFKSKVGSTHLPATEKDIVKLFTSFNNLIEFYCEKRAYDAILLFVGQPAANATLAAVS